MLQDPVALLSKKGVNKQDNPSIPNKNNPRVSVTLFVREYNRVKNKMMLVFEDLFFRILTVSVYTSVELR
jgi:hypothetical protein